MSCDIQQFVEAAGAEGCPCWKVFWPQCHTERAFAEHHGFGDSGFPFKSKEYADSGERRLQQGRGAQRPLARDAHLHLLRLSHLHRGGHEADRRAGWSR